MVLTTLHTNDAPGAVARLGEMGIESFLTASAIECVVAQRLARQLCTYCKRRTVIPQDALSSAGFRVGADLEAYEPVGCARCSHTGYRGRIGLFSVMRMSDEIKSLTVSRAAGGRDRGGGPRAGDAQPARGRAEKGARGGDLDRGDRPGLDVGARKAPPASRSGVT